MKESSITNPLCLCSIRSYLSYRTGLSIDYFEDISSLEHLIGSKNKHRYKQSQCVWILKDGTVCRPLNRRQLGYQLGEVQVWKDNKGNIFETVYPLKEYRIYALVYRKLGDFGVKFEKLGNYEDHLSGGWRAKTPLYKIDNIYFAPGMETTCCQYHPHLHIEGVVKEAFLQ